MAPGPGFSRGQVEAPIELLVSVIILAMSLALAFSVINSSNESQCIAQMRSDVRALESAMVDVAIGSPPTTREVSFAMRTCGTKKVEGLRFVKYKSVDFCKADCASYANGCWKIEPVYVDSGDKLLKPIQEATLCINMPLDMGVEDESSPTSSDLPSNKNCEELVDNPCPDRLDSTCKLSSALTKIQADSDTRPYWRTLGTSKDGARTFTLKLTKRLYLGILGAGEAAGQKGYIGVCALTPKNAGNT